MLILWIVALNKFIEVFALQGIGLESEMLVGTEIVDPELLRPRRFTGGFLVKEKNVRLDALRVEQTSRKTEKRVDFAFVQQLPSNRLPCAAFEEDIIRHNDCRPAVLLQQRFDVLEKIELLVRGRLPEIIALDDLRFSRHFAVIGHNGRAAFFTKGR